MRVVHKQSTLLSCLQIAPAHKQQHTAMHASADSHTHSPCMTLCLLLVNDNDARALSLTHQQAQQAANTHPTAHVRHLGKCFIQHQPSHPLRLHHAQDTPNGTAIRTPTPVAHDARAKAFKRPRETQTSVQQCTLCPQPPCRKLQTASYPRCHSTLLHGSPPLSTQMPHPGKQHQQLRPRSYMRHFTHSQTVQSRSPTS